MTLFRLHSNHQTMKSSGCIGNMKSNIDKMYLTILIANKWIVGCYGFMQNNEMSCIDHGKSSPSSSLDGRAERLEGRRQHLQEVSILATFECRLRETESNH
ncbi:hypothetical protein KP509_03G084600 [Ceratopteris richardii]|uniref:Uncharacterized protein n=1 Tax=Ceratopteris richardii TaxID=49495 RepID=A0A8T2VD39_CERRI|nr:hypothetical protein KP509_03G084600 [Ceratopteris richardii]